MRTRDEIETDIDDYSLIRDRFILEVLLDIRDLLTQHNNHDE